MQKWIGLWFVMICTIAGADATLFSPVVERGITDRAVRLKDAMQTRGVESLHAVSMLSAEKLLTLYKESERYITVNIPQSRHTYRFRIDQVKEGANQKLTLHAVDENGVSKGKLILSFSQEIGIGTITLPEGTFVLHLYRDSGWIGEKRKKRMIDEKGVRPPNQHEKKEILLPSGKVQKSSIQNRTLRDAAPYEIKWMVYLSRALADTFLSKEELELSLENLTEGVNRIYADSHINAVLKLVYYEIIEIEDPASTSNVLNGMSEGESPFFHTLESLQHQYKADVVTTFLTDFFNFAGRGSMNGCYGEARKDECSWWWGNNYNTAIFNAEVVAHEIGHNMGLAHSYAQGEEGSEFTFARGHGVNSRFATIMAYTNYYGVWRNLPLFSNPSSLQCEGLPCGVSHEYDDAADAVYAVKAVLPYFVQTLRENDGEKQISDIENRSLKACLEESARDQSSQMNDYDIKYLSQLKALDCKSVAVKDMNMSLSRLQFFTMTDGNVSGVVQIDALRMIELDMHNNQIEKAVLDNLSFLSFLDLSYNQLQGDLDLSNNPNIDYLFLQGNQIESIVFPQNNRMEIIVLDDNRLNGVLDLSFMAHLTYLNLPYNSLTGLNVENANNLDVLDLSYNNLTHLTLPRQANLEYLNISGNPIDVLNIENLKNIDALYAYDTPLKCWQEKVLLSLNNIDEINAFCIQDDADYFDTDNDGIVNLYDMDDDGDGVDDLSDSDIDGDGVLNRYDKFAIDKERSGDCDQDGLENSLDLDDDNDGVEDTEDLFPCTATESRDSDGDGIGDNADLDDDNDGVADEEDAFPFDGAESRDSDGDGIGDNADLDDDNDGVADEEDAFPFDEAESRDSDGDGIGDNADDDDDNDGRDDDLALRIEALYVAFYNRAGDLDGLNYWYGLIAGGSKTLADLSEGFALHPKFKEKYGSLNHTEFVTKVYINMLGNAPDEGGLHYWVGLLDGGMQKSDFIAIFIGAVFDTDLEKMMHNGQLTQQEYDDAVKRKNILLNKSTVALAFVNHLKEAVNVTMLDDLDHDPAYQASIKIVSGVTEKEASKICAVDFLDGYANGNGPTGIENINSTDLFGRCHASMK